MFEELKKYFGNEIVCKPIKKKPKVALFLAKRDMYRIEIEGLFFVLICVGNEERFGIAALKKQKVIYEEQLQCNVAFSFDVMSKLQRDSLIKAKLPFISLPNQIYLPFLGVVLNDNYKKIKQVNIEKMMPATQMLFLYLLYSQDDYVLKSDAADRLELTRTSMTRASEQLLAMNLIEQQRVGKELRMMKKHDNSSMLEAAKPYLINPIQKKKILREEDVVVPYLLAGENALGEYSMLNPPNLKSVAIYKGELDCSNMEEIDARWEDTDKLIQVEFWKYNPFLFATDNKVDRISLACSLVDCKDERVEMTIDEMLEEL